MFRRHLLRAAALAAVLLSTVVTVGSPARADESDAEKAAREIADARERANRLADDLFAAESRLDTLNVEIANLQIDVAQLEEQVGALQDTVDQLVINSFTSSGTRTIPILSGFEEVERELQVDAFTAVLDDVNAEDLDRYDSLRLDLEEAQASLDTKVAQAEAERANFVRLQAEVADEIERLKAAEQQRLQDEAVQAALEAEEAERARQAALEPEVQPVDTTPPDTALDIDDIDALDNPGFTPAPPTTLPGSGTSGKTGGGGSGGLPGAGTGQIYGGEGWRCPVDMSAGIFFGDTWGAARSGGRRHQGVDMIGARGTALYAVVDGIATPRTNRLGGTTISLAGVDGNEYYYAHLDSYGKLGAVQAGDVIGYLGDTGNAKQSTPHLHFEIQPGGGYAVNPFPTVKQFC